MADNGESSRYAVITEEEIAQLNRSVIPDATRKKAEWAMKIFKDWHNKKFKNNPFPDVPAVYKDVDEMSVYDMNYCLKFFVHEVRKLNGERYGPESLRGLVLSIQNYLKTHFGKSWNFLRDKEFQETRTALDTAMKISNETFASSRSQPIPDDIEDDLWRRGILGDSSPKVLLRTVCYLLGINLGLRGGDEHRQLEFAKLLTLEKTSDGEVLTFHDFGSKTFRGGLDHRRRNKRENAKIFENKYNPDRCPIHLYKLYVSLRPEPCTTSAFYLKPKDRFEGKNWFANAPVGRNTLFSMIKNMMESAGVHG